MTRRAGVVWAALLVLAVLVGAAAPAAAQDTPPTTPDTVSEELGNIIGSPDPGPEPEDAGDRGGWAQLALLGVIVVVVALVLRHLFRSANRNEPPAPA